MDHDAEGRFLTKQAAERAQSCTCGIWYDEEVGTGTLISRAGRLFVLTCEHVASPFFRAKDGLIAFVLRWTHRAEHRVRSDLLIRKTDLRYFRHSRRDDVALIEIVANVDTQQFQPRTLDELHVVDFETFEANRRSFVFSGVPAVLVRAERDVRVMQPFTYLTVDSPTKRQTKHSLFLEYPRGDVPSAKGMSGSLVIALEPRAKQGDLWKYGSPVALVHKAHKKHDYVRCTTLRMVHQWLGRLT